MFQEVLQKRFVFVDFFRRPLDLIDNLLAIFGDKIRHLNVFDLIPTLFDHVQLRRVRRQPLEVKPLRMLPHVLGLKTLVTLKIVPNDNNLVTKILMQCVTPN